MKKVLSLLIFAVLLGFSAQSQENTISTNLSRSDSTQVEDASITIDDIIYWVGNGNNKARLIVNWCDTSIAFAWGVKFDADSVTTQDLLETISKYDSRFSYTYGGTMISDIIFQNEEYSLSLQGNWWMYNVNGLSAMVGFQDQYVHDGDWIKFGDEQCGIVDEETWAYVWTSPVQAVSLPSDTNQTFDGVIESPGCQAIACNDEGIIGWASTCTITRGYQNIANPVAVADYGNDNDATGPSTFSTTEGVVSLGDGGSAVLTFDQVISNGPGYDFAVFENALNNTFLELAFVEVSSDGENFYRFPSVSNTSTVSQIGNAGSTDATKLYNLAGKYRFGWGVPFDLEELEGYSGLDINNITHVRIVDVVGSIDPEYGTFDKNGHIINDPYPTPFSSSGFDLSGVAVMNGWTPTSVQSHNANLELSIYPNPCHNQFTISNQAGKTAILYNAQGKELQRIHISNNNESFGMEHVASGLYFLQIEESIIKIIKH